MPIFDEGFRKSGQNPSIIATSGEGQKTEREDCLAVETLGGFSSG